MSISSRLDENVEKEAAALSISLAMSKETSATNVSPMMRQYRDMKKNYPDAVLLFRVGDFYEAFEQDAIDVSSILQITLTKRNTGAAASDVPLAGFPHHALDSYLHKIVRAGRRVAICDQLEDPKMAKGLVKRGITEVITPGVTVNDKILHAKSNNYLAALSLSNNACGIAFIDVSTTAFYIAEGDLAFMQKLLQSFAPSEIVIAKSALPFVNRHIGTSYYIYTLEDWIFEYGYNKDLIASYFQIHHSLKGFGLENKPNATIAAGAILHYLREIKHPNIDHIGRIQPIYKDSHLWMDQFTIRNLELTGGYMPFFSVIDATQSAMGSRLLKQWVLMPMKDKKSIEDRLSVTRFFIDHSDLHASVSEAIKSCGDIERMVGKVPTRKINPREVRQIAYSLDLLSTIKENCSRADNPYLQELAQQIRPYPNLSERIRHTLVENPPAQVGKESVVGDNVHEELDALRLLLENNKENILRMQQEAINETGIGSLKVGFNHVFGYYLEVSHTHKNKIPPSWIRKQTLANAERYITQDLKVYEEKVLNAQEQILSIEQSVYETLLKEVEKVIADIIKNCHIIAILDCLQGFATKAVRNRYVEPTITEGSTISLLASRHPVIEQSLKASESGGYIPNDIYLDTEKNQILIITGPNMSGKSAILRQTALNIIMAHMGCFVACEKAEIPITERIFTRVGASDNLAGGESTFMVEMNETASIINAISDRSLILLDEIGRGTSTYDGISIAWSILEYLARHPAKPKTLFSTHYHEIVDIESSFDSIKNFHVSNKEENNKIIFLRKLKPGGSMRSFGIHVAKMAGFPSSIIERAYSLLQTLESKENLSPKTKNVQSVLDLIPSPERIPSEEENTFMKRLKQEFYGIDINRITPIEALLKLQELRKMLENM